MTIIVFSKDRALQLDAFLRSYAVHVSPIGTVHVLYASSTQRHARAYAEVFSRHAFAFPCKQQRFKEDVLALVPPSGNVTFFVDDQIFVRPWLVLERPGLSLRLAPHLSRCYPLDCEQPVPLLTEDGELLTWRWADGALDWQYPMSLDGHVYDADTVLTLLTSAAFHSPNSLEAAMQVFAPYYMQRRGSCYRKAKVVNVPWTRVQTDCENRFAGHDNEVMLKHWEAGRQVNIKPFYGLLNESAHQEMPLALEPLDA